MILSRPVAARATRIASIVASVPELTNRICSSWKRSQIASASAIVSGVVTAKWIALLGGLGERLDDLRVGVADDVDAEAAVEVLVLGAVDVPDARALALLEVDRVGVAGLEVRGDAAGQALRRAARVELLGRRCPSSRVFVSLSAISAARALSRSRSTPITS